MKATLRLFLALSVVISGSFFQKANATAGLTGASTTTSISSSNNPSFSTSPGNLVTFTATVTSTSTVNEGTVSFGGAGGTFIGGGVVAVSGGVATVNVLFFNTGAYTIQAVYNGTANFITSSTSIVQNVVPQPPTIAAFSPATGPVGTLVTINGTNLSNPTAFTIGGQSAIVVSNTGSTLVAMVMPGAITGAVSLTTGGGTASGSSNFTVTPTPFPSAQQGNKLVANNSVGAAQQGNSVAVSADGNTAIIGGPNDNSNTGAAWIYTRSGGVWVQQGSKLVGTGSVGTTPAEQGQSVSISADGNTAIVGGVGDNGAVGAAWVYTRSGGVWVQQGSKLVGTGSAGQAEQGWSVSISADGNTAIVGGVDDNGGQGAAWVYTRSGAVWAQQGSKLVGTGSVGTTTEQGVSVSISADGNTAIVGGPQDNGEQGAAWVYTRSGGVWAQQGSKLVGTGGVGIADQGVSVSLSADGNTAIVGGTVDKGGSGAAWVYTRSSGVWAQQGSKLAGTGSVGNAKQGSSVSLSADGNTAIVGGLLDNTLQGAAWVYTRSGGVWSQQGSKLVGTGSVGTTPPEQGFSISISADGNTAIVGGPQDNSSLGASWVYITSPPTTINTIAANSSSPTNAATVQYTATFGALVSAITASNFTLTTTGTISGASVGGIITGIGTNTLTVTVNTGTGDGTIQLNLDNATGMTPGISTPLPFAGAVYTIDKTPPTVSSIKAQDPTPSNGTSVDYTITFSEPVTGVDPSDFTVTASGVSFGGISLTPVSATTYNVTVGSVSGNGTLRLDLSSGTSIADLAGNAISGGFTGGDTYTIDQTAPTFTGVRFLSTHGTYAKIGDVVTLTFGISEAVQPPFVTIDGHLVTAVITDNNLNIYSASYTMIASDEEGRIDFNIMVTDLAGNSASTGAFSGVSIEFDKTPPTVVISAPSVASIGNTGTGSTVTYTVAYADANFNTSNLTNAGITLNTTGTATGTVNITGTVNETGAGTSYTVSISNITGSGTLGISVGAGFANDLAGNTDAGGAPSATFTVDNTAPTVSSITATTPGNTNPTNSTSVAYTVTFSKPVTGVNAGDFTVTTNGTSGTVTNISGNGTTYTVTVSNISGSGTLRLDLKSSSGVTDLAGNAAGGFTGGDVYTIDNTAPTVVSLSRTDPTPTNETSLDWQVTFSEPVTNVNAAGFFTTATGGLSAGAIGVSQVSSTVYNITVPNVSGSGTLQVSLQNSSSITDLAGNFISGGFSGDTYTVNQTLPVVTAIAALGSSPNNASSDQFSVTFSEAVFGVDVTDFALTNTGNVSGTIASVAGSGTTYTVTVTNVTGDGTMRLDLNTSGDPINDAATNILTSAFTTGAVYTIDHTPPAVVSLSRTDPTPSNETSLDWQVTFSEPVTNVNAAGFFTTVTGGLSAGAIGISPVSSTVYNITVPNVSGSGTLQVSLQNSSPISDLAGNFISSGFSGDTYTVNQTLPAVNSITALGSSPNNAGSDQFSVTFSEAVFGVDVTDFALTNTGNVSGTIASVAGSGFNYTVTVNNVTGDGTMRLDLNTSGDPINDAATNILTSAFTTGAVYTIDHTPPTVVSLSRNDPTPTNRTSLDFQVTFSEPVTGVDAADFTATTSGVSASNITFTQQGPTVYNVTINSVSGSGTVRLDLNSSSTGIADLAGNAISGGFTGGDTYTVQQTLPVVTAITALGSSPNNAGSDQFSVTFSEAVFGVDVTDFALTNTGNVSGTIASVAGSGTTYTVTVTNVTGDGTMRLDLNTSGDPINDAATNILTSAFTTGDVYTIDHTSPTVVSLSRTDPTPINETSLDWQVTFSEPVTGVNAAGFFTTTTGGLSAGAIGVSQVSSTVYNITVPNVSGSGTLQVSLQNSSPISDLAGNFISGGFSGDTYTVNQTLPAVNSITALGSSPNNASSDQFSVTFSEDVFRVDATDFTLTNTGNVSGTIASVAGSGSTYTVTVTNVTGDGTMRLDLNAHGDPITDAATNTLTSAFTTGETYTIDHTPPTVVSVTAPDPTPTNRTSLDFQVTFSEPVTGVDAADFTATTSGVSASNITFTQQGPTVYNVTINSVSGSGTVRLDLNSSSTGIADMAGNAISGGFTGGDTYTVDQTSPVVTAITALGSSPNNASSDQFSVTFSEAVFGVDVTDFALTNTGNVSGTIASVAGSGTTYTVTVTNVTGDGTMRLDLNTSGDPINDAATNILTSAFTTGDVYTIDHTSPTVVSLSRTDPTPINETSLDWQVTFSEPVTGVNAAGFFTTTTGGLSAGAIGVSQVSSTVYNITVPNVSGSGTLQVSLQNSSSITDLAGNLISGGFSGDTYTVQQTSPVVTAITALGSSPNNAGSDQFSVTFSEAVFGVDVTDFALTNTGNVSGTIAPVTGSGTTYTVTVTNVTGDGTMRLDLNNTGHPITDAAKNTLTSAFTTGVVYTIDHTPPTVVSITAPDPTPTNRTSLDFQVTFSEPVTGVDAADFTATTSGVSASNITFTQQGPTVYNVTVNSVSGSGTVRLDLNSSSTGIADLAGNAISGGFTGGDTYTVDQTAPVVTAIVALGSSPNNASSDQFSVTFSEDVFGVDATDFTLTNTGNVSGTIAPVTGSGTTYTVTVTNVTGDGTMRLDLNNTGHPITDAAKNTLTSAFTTGVVYTIDHTAPTVVSFTKSDPDPTNETTLHYQLTFSEPVTGVEASDFTVSAIGLTTGTLAVSAASSTVYNVTVNNVIGDGTLQVLLNNGFVSISDLAGNHLSEGATSDTYNVHQNPPAVSTVRATTPSNANPTNATSVSYTVTFSEAVTGVDVSDFTVTTSGGVTGSVTNVSGSFASYTVTVSGISGTGTLRLDLKSGTSVQDIAGNSAPGYTGGDTYTIDQTAPTVSSITATTPSNTSPTNATSVTYTLTFSEPVTGVDASDFTLHGTATVAGLVTNVSGSGSVYTVTVASISGDGTLRLDLNTSGDAITDAAGNAVSAGFSGDTYTIDHTAPVVSSIVAQTPSNTTTPTNATSVVYRVTLSEPITGIVNSDFSVTTTGSVSAAVTGIFGGPLVYAVTVGNISGSGTLRLDFKSGTGLQDAAGNDIGGFTGGDVYTIDQAAPTVTIGAPSQSITSTGPVSYSVTYGDANFNTSTLTSGNITLNKTGTANGTVGVTGSGTSYTVTISNITGSGSLGISIAAGTASDLAGNLAPSAGPSAPFSISSADATLFSLSTSAGTLSPSFTSGHTTYAETVPGTTTSITVKPTANSTNAKSITVTAGGVTHTVASGSSSPAIALAIGPNTITVKITAQDGVTTDSYTITVTRSGSSNANLSNLVVLSNCTLKPSFSTTSYAAAVSNSVTSITVTPTTQDATATVTVGGVTVKSGKASAPIALAVGANTIHVVVTAQDNVTIKTYTIVITRAPSTNAYLAKLAISSGTLTPSFSTYTMAYTASVSSATTSITVTPTTSDATATIKVNGITVLSGVASGSIALAVGKTIINTVVTAQDGKTTITYCITVTRAGATNANLAKLTISSGTLTPAFAPGTTNYTASVSSTTTSITVTPTTSDPTATAKVNGTTVASGTASGNIALAIGKTVINTVVTAQDGKTTITYSITVTRAGSTNASLAKLAISSGTLAPVFTANITGYTASVANTITSITVTPTTGDPTATVKVNGITVKSGSASGGISLTAGKNTITTVVTAGDGKTTLTYTITVTRAPSTNAGLASLKLSCGGLTPAFATGTITYTTSVSNSVKSTTVTPTTSDPTATVKVNGTTVKSGYASGSISLAVGKNTITTVVTAQDGITTKTYTVTVTRATGSYADFIPAISVTKPTETPALAEDGIQVHQGVSPNGDGINDFLTIENISQYPDNKLMIMNRNGQLIYETSGYDNSSKVFDGHSNKNGQMQLPGTYFYQLDYTVKGIVKHKTGFLVLKY